MASAVSSGSKSGYRAWLDQSGSISAGFGTRPHHKHGQGCSATTPIWQREPIRYQFASGVLILRQMCIAIGNENGALRQSRLGDMPDRLITRTSHVLSAIEDDARGCLQTFSTYGFRKKAALKNDTTTDSAADQPGARLVSPEIHPNFAGSMFSGSQHAGTALYTFNCTAPMFIWPFDMECLFSISVK